MATNTPKYLLATLFTISILAQWSHAADSVVAPGGAPQLRNASFRCCVIHGDPFSYKAPRNPFGYDGLSVDFFKQLMLTTDFKCSSFLPFTQNATTGWQEYLKMTSDCSLPNGLLANNASCPCDIAAGTWFEDTNRIQNVSFLPNIMVSDFRVITHINNTHLTTSPWLFIDGLDPLIWMCCVLVSLFFVLIKVLDPDFDSAATASQYWQGRESQRGGVPVIRRKLPRDEARYQSRFGQIRRFILKDPFLHKTRKAAMTTLTASMGNVPSYENRLFRHWMLNFSVCTLGLVFTLVYESAMTAKLVQERVVSDYSGVSDLLNCRIPDEDICIVDGDIVERIWNDKFSKQPCRKEAKRVKIVATYDKLFEDVSKGTCKYALSESGLVLSAQHGRYCGSLITVGEPFGTRSSAMIAPHGWPYFEELRLATLRILETRVVAPSVEEYFESQPSCDIGAQPQLTFMQLRLFFYIVFGAIAVMMLVMVFDRQASGRHVAPAMGLAKEKKLKEYT